MKKRLFTCVICNAQFEGYGHNPAPLKENGECCTICNLQKVMPLRLKEMEKHAHGNQNK